MNKFAAKGMISCSAGIIPRGVGGNVDSNAPPPKKKSQHKNMPLFCVRVAFFLIQCKSLLINKTYLMNKLSGKGCIRMSRGKHTGALGRGKGQAPEICPFMYQCFFIRQTKQKPNKLCLFTTNKLTNFQKKWYPNRQEVTYRGLGARV